MPKVKVTKADIAEDIEALTGETVPNIDKTKRDVLLKMLGDAQIEVEAAAKANSKKTRKNKRNRGDAWTEGDDEGLSAKEVAVELNTDARTVRKFFRDSDMVGRSDRGNRYSIRKAALQGLRTAFAEWLAAQEVEEEVEETD